MNFIEGTNATNLLEASHVKLTLNGRQVLSDVSLHMGPGEIYGLLGPNGAGKSTTIGVILGLYGPEAGDLRLLGEAQGDPIALRRRIGVMPEQAGFYEWMSADQYLAWYAGFYGGLQQPTSELLHLVGLGRSGHRPIGQLSRGMQQRLALARALVHAPELLILDEPTNGLDPRGRREVHDLLLTLARERQVGILLCTHLLDDVERLCNRIGVIDHGRTLAEGTLADLLGRDDSSLRYRLRIGAVPEEPALPEEIALRYREGPWWHVAVTALALPRLARLWGDLIAQGWDIMEIHAEGGDLEALYLHLTGATARSQEAA